MSLESAVVFDHDMEPIYWHLPRGRTMGSIPDSRDLFSFLMENREQVFGVAHSHPGSGDTWYSGTDVRTFSGCELGLGTRLLWPIITYDSVALFAWVGPDKYNYKRVFLDQELKWLPLLRKVSYG